MHLLQEGGPMFMIPLLLMALIILVLFVLSIVGDGTTDRLSIIKQLGTIALAWGLIGSMIGAIGAFDAIEATGGAAPAIVAGGLKLTLLSSLFGLVTFFISRVCALVMKLMSK